MERQRRASLSSLEPICTQIYSKEKYYYILYIDLHNKFIFERKSTVEIREGEIKLRAQSAGDHGVQYMALEVGRGCDGRRDECESDRSAVPTHLICCGS
jgi:hypothetical protein